MSDIKVFKTVKSEKPTDRQLKELFDKCKAVSSVQPWVWDAWYAMHVTPMGPRMLTKSNIISIQIKSLMPYITPMFTGNPNVPDKTPKPNEVLMQYERDLRCTDMSYREYRVPRDAIFRVSALHLTWRKNGGGTTMPTRLHNNMLQIATDAEILNACEWSTWHPQGVLTSTKTDPLPFTTLDKISLDKAQQLDAYIDEINTYNNWYMCNQSLIYQHVYLSTPPTYQPALTTKPIVNALFKKIQPHSYVYLKTMVDVVQLDMLDAYQRMQLLPPGSRQVEHEVLRLQNTYTQLNSQRAHNYDSQVLIRNNTLRDAIARRIANKLWVQLVGKELAQADKAYAKYVAVQEDPLLKVVLQRINRALHTMNARDMQKIVDDLRKSSDFNTKNDWVHLQSGGKLCQHYVMLAMSLLKASHANMDDSAITQACVAQWAEKAPINYKYYCRNCGELLMTDDLEDFTMFRQTIITNNSVKDPIWAYILSEINQTIRRVKFTKSQNPKNLVLAIAQTMEKEMTRIQTELQRSKTKSMEDIRVLMTVYISVYCYAFISNMIIMHPAQLHWVTTTGGRAQKPSTATGGRAQKPSDVAKVLSTAYSMVVDSNQSRISKIKDFAVDQIKPILLHAYEWARNTKFTVVQDEATQDVNWITMFTNNPWYNLIYEMASSYKNIAYTDFTQLFGSKDPRGVLSEERPFANVLRPADKTHHVECYLCLLDWVDSGVYKEFAVPSSPLLLAWWKKWQHLEVWEKNHSDELRLINLHPSAILYVDTGQVPVFEKLDVSFIKCPTGDRHKFTKRVGKDTQCAICGMSINAKKDPRVRALVEYQIDKHNFFVYFANRCPVGDLHTYTVDHQGFISSPCKKCGYTRYSQDMSDSYYKKYRAAYKLTWPDSISLQPTQNWLKNKPVDKWQITTTTVLQIASTSQVPYNQWINLGLSEHVHYVVISTNKYNPQTTVSDAACVSRLLKLRNYVHWVHKQYLLVRNHARVVVPLSLKIVMENDVLASEHDMLAVNMPDILMDFSNRVEYYKYSGQTARITCNYVLHVLCSTLLYIRALDKIKKLAHALFTHCVTYIMGSERTMSELEIQKLQIAAVAESTIDLDDEDVDVVDTMDAETEDPFSYDDVDIETSNTGADDEDAMT